MLDETNTVPDPQSVLDDGDRRVRETAVELFARLNPPVRDPELPADMEPLPIYDWEIAGATEIGLSAVRASLRLLNGTAVEVRAVNDEHRVIAVTAAHPASSAA